MKTNTQSNFQAGSQKSKMQSNGFSITHKQVEAEYKQDVIMQNQTSASRKTSMDNSMPNSKKKHSEQRSNKAIQPQKAQSRSIGNRYSNVNQTNTSSAFHLTSKLSNSLDRSQTYKATGIQKQSIQTERFRNQYLGNPKK